MVFYFLTVSLSLDKCVGLFHPWSVSSDKFLPPLLLTPRTQLSREEVCPTRVTAQKGTAFAQTSQTSHQKKKKKKCFLLGLVSLSRRIPPMETWRWASGEQLCETKLLTRSDPPTFAFTDHLAPLVSRPFCRLHRGAK